MWIRTGRRAVRRLRRGLEGRFSMPYRSRATFLFTLYLLPRHPTYPLRMLLVFCVLDFRFFVLSSIELIDLFWCYPIDYNDCTVYICSFYFMTLFFIFQATASKQETHCPLKHPDPTLPSEPPTSATQLFEDWNSCYCQGWVETVPGDRGWTSSLSLKKRLRDRFWVGRKWSCCLWRGVCVDRGEL